MHRKSNVSPVVLTVQKKSGNQSSPLLYGVMFEGTNPGLTAYSAVGDVEISQDMLNPLSDAITSTLQVQVMPWETGFAGFVNKGYNGVPVMNATYRCEFWMRGEYSDVITLQLVGISSDIVYAAHNMTVNSTSRSFTRYETTFNSTASPDGDNEFRLLFDGSKVPGMKLNFGLIQLFPPTYHSRLTRDGRGIGPLDLLSTVLGESDWFYPNTDALGLDEYLWWCQDMGMEPVLAVWDGKSFGGILTGSDLQPYVDDILDELEYLLGPPNSTYGGMRASNGREDPWSVRYIEIGNEDDFSGGCNTYPDRFQQIYNAISEKYPQLTIVASTIDGRCLPEALPGIIYDYHYYRRPDELAAMFDEWDNQPRSQPVMCSCSEAVHMIGLERNSDVVKMAAYTPLLQHFGFTQWSPTLYGFDSGPDSITLSTSYYVQKMFSTNRGTTILPVKTTAEFGPLYWVASRANSTYYVKLANYGEEKQTVHVQVPDTRSGRLEMLSGPRDASNRPHNITVQPSVQKVTNQRGSYKFDMAAWAVAVLAVS
ncbi:uncharacterized protein ATNIH1004_001935 [Aspergillus tanneri]|uniref:non-reducing end alpha-L-arabinofuranosidase n=1 Tax=Aspergillus tanneri TaxID=1220188 RepID=A0A5M9M7K0_9EURO|nr:uncharacterized protein ATNIH1004_001935 [Aspergillus tanneri]KAA8641470.1 hypothetical protein ATNIH1004_001935 [Aspergillus tanneri]